MVVLVLISFLTHESSRMQMQITSRLTQSGYHYRGSRLRCQLLFVASSHGVCTCHSVPAPLISIRNNMYSWRFLTSQEEAKQTGKSTEGPKRALDYSVILFSSSLVLSSYRARVLSFARTRGGGGLVLARQNLTKQFAPKQTTASGLLVNKQHIYF
jgi:hypothetical protein